jgi:hypothetical protein
MRLLRMIFIPFLFISLSIFGYSQPSSLGLEDLYGLKIQVLDSVLNAKCDCCSTIERANCNLFKIKILEVYFMEDLAIYPESDSLTKVQYMIAMDGLPIIPGKIAFVTCANTCSKLMLKTVQLVENSFFNKVNRSIAHVTGLSICYDFSFWQKLQLRLGIRRQKIRSKANSIDVRKSKFVKMIFENEGKT